MRDPQGVIVVFEGELVCFINFCQVGVLYVGPGQENDEKAIFSNQFGSIRYR